MKIGLFFGSFNPIHVGHLAIGNYIAQFTDIQQVWFVVSPQNPLKEKKTLLADYHRLELAYRAIGESSLFKVSNIEFNMPKPSYTIDTLSYLVDKYPQHKFSVIIGSDSLESFYKWKNFETILNLYRIYVYPRRGNETHELMHNINVKIVNAPIIEISSSFIRQAIKDGKDMQYFVTNEVWKYICEMHFYEK